MCTSALADKVVKVGPYYYSSLQEAINAFPDEEVVLTLLANISENVTIPATFKGTIDMDNMTLSGTTSDEPTITIASGATVVISGIEGSKITNNLNKATIKNNGTLTLDSEHVIYENTSTKYPSMVVDNCGTLTINSGTLSGGSYNINNERTATKLEITGGTFKGYSSEAVENVSVATISGGTFTSTGDALTAIRTEGAYGVNATTTISGGTFTGGVHNCLYCSAYAVCDISGGDFTGTLYSDPVNGPHYSITGGTFKDAPNYYFLAGGYGMTLDEETSRYQVVQVPMVIVNNISSYYDYIQTNVINYNKNVRQYVPDLKSSLSLDLSTALRSYVKLIAKSHTTGDNVVKTMTFDVKAYYVNALGEEVEITSADIASPIKLRFPVYLYRGNMKVGEIKASGTSLGVYNIYGDGSNGYYLEALSSTFGEYTYELDNMIGTIYQGSSDLYQTGKSIAVFQSVQNSYRNAVMIVDSKYATAAKDFKNIILKYTSGDETHYECPNFVLTDWVDNSDNSYSNFYSPVDFTALSGSYTRTGVVGNGSTDSYASVCLPFALTNANIGGQGSIMTFSNYDSSDNNVYFTTQESVEAGTPCIVTGYGADWTTTFNNTEIKATPVTSGKMQGSYKYQKIGADKYKLTSDGKRFGKTNSSAVVYPFRAYLTIDTANSDAAKSGIIDIALDNDLSTGVNAVDASSIFNGTIYDVNGVRKESVTKGINIIKGNDGTVRKVIIK